MQMGRRRTTNLDLPPRMHFKRGQYWYVPSYGTRKWQALGKDLVLARRKWADLECGEIEQQTTFAHIAKVYTEKCLPEKAPRTQIEYAREIAMLVSVFGEMRVDDIRPAHIRQYMDARTAKVSANRERATFSAIFNWARERGYMDGANPATGVKTNQERPRESYVEDAAYRAVYAYATEPLRDAMDLAYLTAQRVSDVLSWQRTDIQAGCLHVQQGKTGKKLRIEITGELAAVIERIKSRPGRVSSLRLVANERGQPVTYAALFKQFNAARIKAGQSWQFRDLRAKAATESATLDDAKRLLGHQSVTMTEAYVRDRIGQTVKPLK